MSDMTQRLCTNHNVTFRLLHSTQLIGHAARLLYC